MGLFDEDKPSKNQAEYELMMHEAEDVRVKTLARLIENEVIKLLPK